MNKPLLMLAILLPVAVGQACAPVSKSRSGPAINGAPSAAGNGPPYPAMGPLAEYAIANHDEEIALARSSAPASISTDAEILVLGANGYESAAKGKNGFVCIVQRSWAAGFDDPEFWNPKLRAPNCFNAPAVRTVLAQYLKRTEWVLAGASKQELINRTRAAFASKVFSDPEPAAMSYMMSPHGYLSDADGHWLPHVMFFMPRTAAASWGANLAGSPIIAREGDENDPATIFLIPVRRWSDGSAAPVPTDHRM